VSCWARRVDRLQSLANELTGRGGKALAVPTDVTHYDLPAESFAQAVAFALSQPREVDVNEILFRPTRQIL
jgi:NADP-dependent 3-hydroxy acid dehydrogenase YdfG